MGDSKYRPCPLLANYVNAGWLGKKSGRGFYKYWLILKKIINDEIIYKM